MLMYIAAISSILAVSLLAIKPRWGVLAIFLVRPLVDTQWDQSLLAGLKLTELISTIVPLVIFCRMAVDDASTRPFRDMPLKSVWLIWSIYVFMFSSTIMFSQGLLDGSAVLMRHLNGLAGFYMVQAYCRDDRDVRQFAWVLVLAGIFPVATGCYEGLTGTHWRITTGEDNVVRNIGLYHDAITIRYYALQTIMGLLLVSVLMTKKSKMLVGLLLAYGLAALYVVKGAYSKSGVLTVCAWMLLWPLLRKNTKMLVGLAAGTVVVGLYYSKAVMDSIGFVFVKEIGALQGQVGVERTFAGRWYFWIDMMKEWSGLDAFQQIFGAGRVATGAHNDYLQILFHGGIVGVAIYVVLLVSVAVKIGQLLIAKREVYAIAALLALIMWIIDTIGLVPSAYSGYQWFVWGVIGLCLRRRQDEQFGVNEVVQQETPKRFANLMGVA